VGPSSCLSLRNNNHRPQEEVQNSGVCSLGTGLLSAALACSLLRGPRAFWE